MNICIIVYLFMSFVGHIEVKESPSKILKLINCIFIQERIKPLYSLLIHLYNFLSQNYLFAYNTRSGTFSGLAL